MKKYQFNYNYEKKLFGSSGEKHLSKKEESILLRFIGNVYNKKILDVGTGSGRLASPLVERGAIVSGIDESDDMLKQAKSKGFPSSRYALHKGDIQSLKQFKDDYFDAIICFRVLKYVPERNEVLSEMSRVIKKDGTLLLEISNFYSFEAVLRWIDFIKLGKSNRYNLLKYKEIKRNLSKRGFVVTKLTPTTKIPHVFWRLLGKRAETIDKILTTITPIQFLSRGLVIKAKRQ